MKAVLAGLLSSLLVLSLAACASKNGDSIVRVKCPACGYEFDALTE